MNKEVEKQEVSIPFIINEQSIRNKIYIIRNQKVMLDFDLAEIYGYETKNFNRQVKNNSKKFEGNDFMFQLTEEEFHINLRCKKFTSSWGGHRYLPNAFTESGIYMLMTVLKGDLAVKQSRALIRTFKAMKDYIVGNDELLYHHDLLQFSDRISNNQNEIADMHKEMENKFGIVFHQLDETVKRSEISPVLLDFSKPSEQKEYLILNGQPFTADEAYMQIYAQAEKSIHIIDDYISIKTLHLLRDVQPEISITILSDNTGKHLKESDYEDFITEYHDKKITFFKTNHLVHDRYIILDYETEKERIFLCGSSSKDSGRRITTIAEMREHLFKSALNDAIKNLLPK